MPVPPAPCGVPLLSAGIPGSGQLLLQSRGPAGVAGAGIAGAVWELAGGDAVTVPLPDFVIPGTFVRIPFLSVFSPSLSFSPSLFAFFSPPPVSMWADHCSNF